MIAQVLPFPSVTRRQTYKERQEGWRKLTFIELLPGVLVGIWIFYTSFCNQHLCFVFVCLYLFLRCGLVMLPGFSQTPGLKDPMLQPLISCDYRQVSLCQVYQILFEGFQCACHIVRHHIWSSKQSRHCHRPHGSSEASGKSIHLNT
jgi:hypothetical protein